MLTALFVEEDFVIFVFVVVVIKEAISLSIL